MNKRPLRPVTNAHIEAYQRDGVALLRGMIDAEWIERLLAEWTAISQSAGNLRNIYPLAQEYLDRDPILREEMESIVNSGALGDSYTEQAEGFIRCKYMRFWNPVFRSFLLDSPVAEMVGLTIGVDEVRIYSDAMFVKKPACTTSTYWHADRPAWPVQGDQLPTVWMPLLPVRKTVSCLEFIAGSHRLPDGGWPNTYNAKKLGKPAGWPEIADWEGRRDDPDVTFLSFDMEPGDALVIHSRTHHGGGPNLHPTQPRIALSTRWLGDGLVWDPRPECINMPGAPLHEMRRGAPVDQDETFPVAWRRQREVEYSDA